MGAFKTVRLTCHGWRAAVSRMYETRRERAAHAAQAKATGVAAAETAELTIDRPYSAIEAQLLEELPDEAARRGLARLVIAVCQMRGPKVGEAVRRAHSKMTDRTLAEAAGREYPVVARMCAECKRGDDKAVKAERLVAVSIVFGWLEEIIF